ncbi:MAG: DUF3488 and DUF4129 domain-containing transglutaminase family protein [Nodosilinea sp. LVE1205-7]
MVRLRTSQQGFSSWLATTPLGRSPQPAEVEHSPLLRGLVQGLVSVGILAVVVAAAGVTQASILNLLAIPLSGAGAFYSWWQRQRANALMKALIAVAMVLALGFFFFRLLHQPGDTRILLAELLIQLQVFHSFDLPRRKDLGYSMVIGLILLGVAATISQTLSFAPLVGLFLVLALPVLALDYRSRLGLGSVAGRSGAAGIRPGQLLGWVGLTMALGLVIFLGLPRLPGYQIQNFPVSLSLDTPAGFTGRRILNPAYRQNNSPSTTATFGQGLNPSTVEGQGNLSGPGRVDSTAYYGFNQQMNQNLRGVMQPQVVMRVQSQAPGFWRVLAFDRYTGQGWTQGQPDRIQTLSRSELTYQTLLPLEPGLNRWQEVVQTYTLVSNFPNLIPTLPQAREVYFPTQAVAIDDQGSLRSPIGLEAGMTYTVVSKVAFRDRSQLRQAPRHYSQSIQQQYLQLPERVSDRIRQQTQSLLALSPKPLRDPYEQALHLAQALKQRYSLQPNLPFLAPQEDLVESFLFKLKGGYPNHFSTVLTVMLRSIGIPARLVVGFGEGQFNPFTGFYVVRNTDAYALTEVYFPQYGWFAFDPIPGHELLPPELRESDYFSTLRRFWHWVAGWLPSPLVGGINQLVDYLGQLLHHGLAGAMGLVRWGWVGLVLLGLGGGALGLGWRSWRLAHVPPTERIYQQMLTWFNQQGLAKHRAETPLEYGQRIEAKIPIKQAEAMKSLVNAYVSWRYGGETQDLTDLSQKLQIIRYRSTRSSTFFWPPKR